MLVCKPGVEFRLFLAERTTLCSVFTYLFFVFNGPSSYSVIPESAGAIFTKFSGLVDVWEGFIKRSFILRSLKGRCRGNQFLKPNLRNWPTPPSFRNGLQDRNFGFGGLNGNDLSTLVTPGPVK